MSASLTARLSALVAVALALACLSCTASSESSRNDPALSCERRMGTMYGVALAPTTESKNSSEQTPATTKGLGLRGPERQRPLDFGFCAPKAVAPDGTLVLSWQPADDGSEPRVDVVDDRSVGPDFTTCAVTALRQAWALPGKPSHQKDAGERSKERQATWVVFSGNGRQAAPGSLAKEEIRQIIRASSGVLANCHQDRLKNGVNAQGKVRTQFVIGPTGAVRAAAVLESTVNDQLLEGCVLELV